MMAYFDGLIDVHNASELEARIKFTLPLTDMIPYVLPWRNVYVALSNMDLPDRHVLRVLNGAIVGLLSYDHPLPYPIGRSLLRLSPVPLLPCIGLGKWLMKDYEVICIFGGTLIYRCTIFSFS